MSGTTCALAVGLLSLVFWGVCEQGAKAACPCGSASTASPAASNTVPGAVQLSCAADAVLSLARLVGKKIDQAEKDRLEKSLAGVVSLQRLVDDAQAVGIALTPLRGGYRALCALKRPVIAHMITPRGGHFVAVESADEAKVRLVDSSGARDMPAAEFRLYFSGHFAAVLKPSDHVSPAPSSKSAA